MHKKEILKVSNKVNLEGYTLIPLKVYFKDSKAKILLGVCKGKKLYDKRESAKEEDIKRDLAKRKY
jgi:SsrA-binding protein